MHDESLTVTRARTIPGLTPGAPALVDVTLADGVIQGITAHEGARGDIDADGAVILPGLWDAHVHFGTHALINRAIPLPAQGGAEPVLQLVREACRSSVGPVVGYGFCAADWEQPPTAQQLDDLTDRPVALIGGDLHSVWANRAGLALIGRDDHPTGLLVEADAFAAIEELMRSGGEHLGTSVMAAASDAVAKGIVGIVDMEAGAAEAWSSRAADTPLPFRVVAASYPADLAGVIAARRVSGESLAPLVTLGPLKVIADGSMGSRTAQCRHAYPNPLPALPHGRANYDDAELRELLRQSTAAGLRIAVHAIGDLALARVLDAVAATGALGTVEHAQFATAEDITRMAQLKLGASIQPAHLIADQTLLDDVWPQAGADAFPWRSMVAAGVQLTLGSDAPVAPLDPWLAMDAAVTRTHHPNQALAPMEAIRSSIRTALALGQAADLVLVDRCPDELLRGNFIGTTAQATFVAGRLIHAAG